MGDGEFQRNTRQRSVILEELRMSCAHPTAVELFERVRRRLPRISLGTVYRNLDLLTEMGTIQKLDLSGAEARFDGNLEPHYHVRCERCGRVDDVDGPPPSLLGEKLTHAAGYEILGHRLEFIGVCPGCRNSQATENNDRQTTSAKECPPC